MQSDNPTAAILLIGDEILSGRTRDLNAHHLAGVLNAIGIDLREIRVVADDHDPVREVSTAEPPPSSGRTAVTVVSGCTCAPPASARCR